MPIARKPKSTSKVSERDITAVIEKGGSVPTDKTSKGKSEQIVNLRLPEDVLNEINNSVSSRRIKISRHTWLMEAIIEKLDRESSNNK